MPQDWPETKRSLQGGWTLTDGRLLSPDGCSFGPSELLGVSDVAEMRAVPVTTLHPNIVRRSKTAGDGWMRVGRKSGWAIFAADALRP